MEVRKQWNDSLSIERKKIAILKFYIQKKKIPQNKGQNNVFR